ncbi:MAG: RsmE family RNA methyltransferase [Leptospiraceae bacterium]|nr:RsmE family RNA methyltransferase [Leptospiraceae bacterium]
MNLLILESSEWNGSSFSLKERKLEHIQKVWKAKIGDVYQAGLLNESYGTIQILNLTSAEVLVSYTPSSSKKNYNPSFQLYSSFQRPQTTKKILQLAATCGLSKIFFFPFEKSEKSYETSTLWRENAYEKELILGLEQGKKVEMPEVKWSFENKERILFTFPYPTFLLDLDGKNIFKYKQILESSPSEIGLILGPESGLTKEDKDFFLKRGVYPLKLSKNTLRSEFALAFALSQLELVLEEKNEYNQ